TRTDETFVDHSAVSPEHRPAIRSRGPIHLRRETYQRHPTRAGTSTRARETDTHTPAPPPEYSASWSYACARLRRRPHWAAPPSPQQSSRSKQTRVGRTLLSDAVDF